MTKRKSTKEQTTINKNTHKTRVTRTPLKTGDELSCFGRFSNSCSTSGTHRVNRVTNPVISHEWGKEREVFTTSGTYVLFVTQIFHNGQPCHGDDRKTFEVMTSTIPRGILGSVASLLAATFYQGNPDRNHKLWNIVLTERYSICRCCWNVATYKWKVHNGLYRTKLAYFNQNAQSDIEPGVIAENDICRLLYLINLSIPIKL